MSIIHSDNIHSHREVHVHTLADLFIFQDFIVIHLGNTQKRPLHMLTMEQTKSQSVNTSCHLGDTHLSVEAAEVHTMLDFFPELLFMSFLFIS